MKSFKKLYFFSIGLLVVGLSVGVLSSTAPTTTTDKTAPTEDSGFGQGACKTGTLQSPIDFDQKAVNVIQAGLKKIDFHYQSNTATKCIEHEATCINLGTNKPNYITVDGIRYDLIKFHFHKTSEHTVQGNHYALELHLVHKEHATQQQILVIGVFVQAATKKGSALKGIDTLLKGWPATDEKSAPLGTIDVAALLPKTQEEYRYLGSLTTPPYTEGVKWIVMKNPITMSTDQVKTIRTGAGDARPTQDQHGRLIVIEA